MSDEANTEPRRRGRPPGQPKTGGRQRGTPNATTSEMRQMILARGKPLELLCKIASGERIRIGPQAGPDKAVYDYPTLKERAEAGRILLNKILPDIKLQELCGPDGKPIEMKSNLDPNTVSNFELARRVCLILHEASAEADTRAAQTPEPQDKPCG